MHWTCVRSADELIDPHHEVSALRLAFFSITGVMSFQSALIWQEAAHALPGGGGGGGDHFKSCK